MAIAETGLEPADAGLAAKSRVDGPSAAAILLMLLGEDEAAAILRDLEPSEVSALGKAMYAVADASEETVEAALDRFLARCRDVPTLAIGAAPHIRNIMTHALGNVRANNLLASIAPQSAGAALDILRWMDVATITTILAEEHPQVGALVIAVLTPDTAAKALEGITDDVQADLLYRAARLETVNDDAIADLERLFARYADAQVAVPGRPVGGQSGIAKIVNSMPRPASERILKTVKKRDKTIGQGIEDEMFIFENLRDLDGKTLGAIVRTVDAQILTVALKGASDALIDMALGSMSARAAQTIRDDMAESGPVKRADVEDAQKAVILAVRSLIADGTIALGQGGDDYV